MLPIAQALAENSVPPPTGSIFTFFDSNFGSTFFGVLLAQLLAIGVYAWTQRLERYHRLREAAVAMLSSIDATLAQVRDNTAALREGSWPSEFVRAGRFDPSYVATSLLCYADAPALAQSLVHIEAHIAALRAVDEEMVQSMNRTLATGSEKAAIFRQNAATPIRLMEELERRLTPHVEHLRRVTERPRFWRWLLQGVRQLG